MAWKQVKNWSSTTIPAAVSDSALSITVADATLLPAAEFWAVIWNAGEGAPDADTAREIVLVTDVTGNVLTITRGQQSTVAAAHPAGCTIANVITAGDKEELTGAIDALTLDDLADVATAGVADNDVLTYDLATETWGPAAGAGSPSLALDDLTDVATAGVATGNPLVYTGSGWGPGGDTAVAGRLDAALTYTTAGDTALDRLCELSAIVSSDNATAARYPRALFAQIDVAGATNFGGTSTVIGLQGQARHYTSGVSVASLIGLYGRAGAWNAVTCTECIGLQGVVQSGIFGGGSSSSPSATLTTAVAIDASLTIFNNGTLTSTNAYLFRGTASKPGSGVSAITNFYGLYLPAITYGVTTNWALYCAGGDSAHAGNMRFGGVTAPAYAVDVTGAIAASGAFGVNGATPQTAYASGGAVSTSAGSYGFASDTERSNLTTLVANIRAALVANGIMS